MASTSQQTKSQGKIKNELFQSVMKGQWNEVVEIYEKHQEVHETKITRAGDTALHVAVYENQGGIFKKLIEKIQDPKKALKIGNEQGNTPLHFAASMGNVAMCKLMADKLVAEADPSPVGIRNKNGETPLFVAALHGKKEAFLHLQKIYGKDGTRRFNGDTILHCAIAGEYFELALQIIYYYEDLVDTVNDQGLSALHLLASKPSAFRSGSSLAGYSQFIYRCIFVDSVKMEAPDDESEDHNDGNYPDNYKTCIQFFQLLLNVARGGKEKVGKKKDEENPVGQGIRKNEENPGDQGACIPWIRLEEREENPADQGHRLFPATYDTCFELLKLAAKAMLTLLGLGHSGIRRMRDEKRKHIWAVQIVEEILKRTSTYQDNTTGWSPEPEASQKEDETSAYNRHDIVEAGGSGGGDNKGKAEKEEDTKETMTETPIPRDAQHIITEIVMRTLKLLVDKEENPEETMRENPPPPAAQQGDTKILPVEKEENSRKTMKETPISLAAQHVITEIVERILKLLFVEKEKNSKSSMMETPILLAAKYGIIEIVERILKLFPVAIHDTNVDNKNMALLAAEYRQPHIFQHLLKRDMPGDSVLGKVDKDGNTALHLAAKFEKDRPWHIPGAALQMQWEYKWYEVRGQIRHAKLY